MARPTSDEEVQLKKRARRRLVGAVVLATAVAVVLPMVLDTEPKPVSQNVNIQIPSPDSPAYAPKAAAPGSVDAESKPSAPPVASLQSPVAPKGGEAVKPAEAPKEAPEAAKAPPRAAETPKETTKEAAAATPKDAAKPAGKDDGKAADKAAPKDSGKPAAKDAGKAATDAAKAPAKDAKAAPKASVNARFVVQVAALADAAKAKQLQQKVAAAGVKAYTEVVQTSKGSVTRVRAGPYDSREAAEKARSRLKGAGLDGKVVPR